MLRHLATYDNNLKGGEAQIHYDPSDETFHIAYINADGEKFFTEHFPDKSVHYVKDAAENWTLGIKILEHTNCGSPDCCGEC